MNNKKNKDSSPTQPEGQAPDTFAVRNAMDSTILMHRDAHFGSNFDVMLDYYRAGGRGVNPEIEISNIETLAELEKQVGENLANLYLTEAEAEKVISATDEYKRLRDLYEDSAKEKRLARLIADLILTEDEDAKEEIAALAKEGKVVVPSLIKLLKTETYNDPLFPGYGQTAVLAAKTLGEIGSPEAVGALFEVMRDGDFFQEEVILDALKHIGEPAKAFLLKILHTRPIHRNADQAAIALIAFRDDSKVAKECLDLLQDPDVRREPVMATYLVLACEGLKNPEDRQKFLSMANDPSISSSIKLDIKAVAKEWD